MIILKKELSRECKYDHYGELKSLFHEPGPEFYECSLRILKIRCRTRIGYVRMKEMGFYELCQGGDFIGARRLWYSVENAFFNQYGYYAQSESEFFTNLESKDKEIFQRFIASEKYTEDDMTFNQRYDYVFEMTNLLVNSLIVEDWSEYRAKVKILASIMKEHPQVFEEFTPLLYFFLKCSFSEKQFQTYLTKEKFMHRAQDFKQMLNIDKMKEISNVQVSTDGELIDFSTLSYDVVFFHIFSFLDLTELLRMSLSSKMFCESIWNRSMKQRRSKCCRMFYYLFGRHKIIGDEILSRLLHLEVLDWREVFIYTFPHLFELDYVKTLTFFSQKKIENSRFSVFLNQYIPFRYYDFERVMGSVKGFGEYAKQGIRDKFWQSQMLGILRFFVLRHPTVCVSKKLCTIIFKCLRNYENQDRFLTGLELINKIYITNCQGSDGKDMESRKKQFLLFFTSLCRKNEENFKIGFEWILKKFSGHYSESVLYNLAKKIIIEKWKNGSFVVRTIINKLDKKKFPSLLPVCYERNPNSVCFLELLQLYEDEISCRKVFFKTLMKITTKINTKRKEDGAGKNLLDADDILIVQHCLQYFSGLDERSDESLDFSMENNILLRTFYEYHEIVRLLIKDSRVSCSDNNYEVLWNLCESYSSNRKSPLECNWRIDYNPRLCFKLLFARSDIPFTSGDFCLKITEKICEKFVRIEDSFEVMKFLMNNEAYSKSTSLEKCKELLMEKFKTWIGEEHLKHRIANGNFQNPFYQSRRILDLFFLFLRNFYYPNKSQINEIFDHFCRMNHVMMITEFRKIYVKEIDEERSHISNILKHFSNKGFAERIFLAQVLGFCSLYVTRKEKEEWGFLATRSLCLTCSSTDGGQVYICYSCSQKCHEGHEIILKHIPRNSACMCNIYNNCQL